MLDRFVREQAECWIAAILVTVLVLAGVAFREAPLPDPEVAASFAVRTLTALPALFAVESACDAGACLRI